MFIYRKEKWAVPCENCHRTIEPTEDRLVFKNNYIMWRLCNDCLDRMRKK